jgi:lipoate-protein ligase A
LLPESVADGAWQMAADEAMLESAANGTASIRFYRWSEATLSLGYFQPHAVRQRDRLLAQLPFVRRPTGGATLVHHHELTYGLALPVGEPWQRRGESWLARMHSIIAGALADSGVQVTAVEPGERRKSGEVLCFLDQTPGDLLCRGHKVVGSAQRKHKLALLQHGSILLEQSQYTPELPGLQELATLHRDDCRAVAKAILAAFERATGWCIEACDWSAEEAARRDALVRSRYANPSWNLKR